MILKMIYTDPPSQPFIHGYTEGTHVPAGTVQKISCTSSGGNPLASLTWYKNDKKVSFNCKQSNNATIKLHETSRSTLPQNPQTSQ